MTEITDDMRAAGLAALHADNDWHKPDSGGGVWRANYSRAVDLVLAAALPHLTDDPPKQICGDVCRSFGVDLLCRKQTGHDGEHQDVHGATWSYLTDDGAGSGEPAVAAGEAGSIPAGNPAPSSPHPEADKAALWHLLVNHYYDAGWSKEHQGFRCVCGWLGESHVDHVVGLVSAALFGEGATPAIDREALRCLADRYTTEVADALTETHTAATETLLEYADAVLSLAVKP